MKLETLSLEELKTLQDDVAVAIFNFEKRKKAEALAELHALALKKGFSLEELLDDGKGKKKKQTGAVKYMDPKNSENTWSGRGRKPKWLVQELSEGKSLDDFAL